MADRKPTMKIVDMTEDMQRHALKLALDAMGIPNTTEKEIASTIRKTFEDTYRGTWHCIVGRNFGSYVTHETKHFIYFTIGQVAILLFKSS